MDGVSELAKMFKDRDNKRIYGITIGKVITPPPEVKIRLNEKVILEKEHLVFTETVSKQTLLENQELILMPTVDGQLYFVIDRAVRM